VQFALLHAPALQPARRKPLDRLREALRSRRYSRRTEQTNCHWVKRFDHFHNLRHPPDMGEKEINAFLTHLAVRENAAASTQNQALSALLFLCRRVLGREVGDLGEVIRARRPELLPVVLTRDEVKAVLFATPSCIPSSRISWNRAMTSARFKNCWATRTSAPP
jgi:integrase